MKKLFTLLTILLMFKYDASCQYCTTGIATTNTEDEIFNVTIGSILNNSSDCNTSLPAPSIQNRYSDYSNTLPQILIPIGTHTISLTRGPDCNGAHNSTAGAVVFIDYNQDGDWLDANERVVVFANGIAQNQSVTSSFTVPNNVTVGLTKMRVMMGENMNGNTQNPCTNYTWGETEDYTIFLGKKKWDYEMVSMLAPDSISFCGQDPVVLKVKIKNVENQPIPGGRVDLFIKGLETGSTTNLYYSKAFTQSVLTDEELELSFNPILFPKDELLEFKYVVYHPLDSNPGNDTLIKNVQVFKNPVYKLKGDTICADSFNTTMITDMPKPLYFKWDNEAIIDTTTYNLTASRFVGINITRGWKCNVTDSVYLMVKPLPKLTVTPDDTVLCNGQTAALKVSMDLPQTYLGFDTNSSTTYTTSSSGSYIARGIATNGCTNTTIGNVTVVNPPAQPRVTDTVCLGESATIGLDNNVTGFIYKWQGLSETTPLIHPVPTVSGQKYYVQWWYQGCTDRDTVSVKVNPLPPVAISATKQSICPYFSTTLSVSGANNYNWNNGLGTGTSKTVSPMTNTTYHVIGTDNNGCSKEVSYKVILHPKPDMHVYSNKYKDNICLGDSATIYVNGGKTYQWSTGNTDSIIKVYPTESFQWSMIGTDANGCKDTLSYRMNVKPEFKISYDKNLTGCEGDSIEVKLSGAKQYEWGLFDDPQYYISDSSKWIFPLARSTSYQVTATSPFECQIVVNVPVTVLESPVAQISDLTICQGETGVLEASGGLTYDWGTNPNINSISTDNSKVEYKGTITNDISVTVKNEAGCADIATTTVNVISTHQDSIPVVFKSPKDTYFCPSQAIPITLSATPVGGVWSGGAAVSDNKFNVKGLSGNVQVLYTFFEPRKGCKVEAVKHFVIVTKCANSINSLEDNHPWSVYPNPFDDVLHIEIEQSKNEEAFIHIYDIAGRIVYEQNQTLHLGTNKIDLSNLNLSKGTYYLELESESANRQIKILAR